MVNLANRLNSVQSKSEIVKKLRLDSAFRYVVRLVFNFLIPIYYKITKTPVLCQDRSNNKKIIVSLTTFPLRIGRVWIVIESLLRQKVKPDRIILWLSKEQFNGIESLPSNLLRLQKYGLTIRFVDGDIKSYKKFYYAIKEYPEDILITVDDDILYPDYMISDLYELYQENPNSIIARYCYEMKWKNQEIQSYNKWKKLGQYTHYQSNNLFFGSGGGVLFPPKSIAEEALNKSVFWELCRNADDVWLNAMAHLRGTEIKKVNRKCIIFPILRRCDLTLFSQNENDNDRFIHALQGYYKNKVYQEK